MLTNVQIKNFKCYEDENTFDLNGITIVSGTNSSGKSSLLQAIYLLTQNKTSNYTYLALNSELNLGGFSDVLNKSKGNIESLELSFTYEKSLLENYNLDYLDVNLVYRNPNTFKNLPVKPFETNPILSKIEVYSLDADRQPHEYSIEIDDSKELEVKYHISSELDNGYCKLNGFVPEPIIFEENMKKIVSDNLEKIITLLKMINNENIRYIKAFRNDNLDSANGISTGNLGLSGENTAKVISQNQSLTTDLSIDGINKFSYIFDYWIKKLLGKEYKVISKMIDSNKYKIIITNTETNYEFSLDQIGFGVSQLLPVFTLLLTSKKNDVILIENPEVHLHPKLQSVFIDFCIFIFNNNRKLIIETHSEHIVNKLRINIKKDLIISNRVNILFFEQSNGQLRHSDIEIFEDGRIKSWPADFFDQTYYDLLGLIE
ncbi:atpase aaa-type core [Trichococcus flocculiformis]|uniref:Atpase aaa-type core n=1 Tax=Trichococcus flocculiformis TaxID=82803 RepID=A0AB38BKL1_9LACT|nr:DUF3696 domain-containing protein [Trichococcus flocculiformis]SBO15729.1 atpase aaa-type core [Trichococcus flocculiformis]SFI09144.1 Protein of unknown function [Trichococcus flocculiformis]